jgi:hypothetical protein
MPEGARDEPDLRSLGVGSLRLPGILVPEGGSPPGYPYILLGELHRDDDGSDERLPDEFDSDQVPVPSADPNKDAGSVAPRHLAEDGNKPVAATTGASLAPIGQDSMESNGAPPPVPAFANSIGANGMMPSTSEAIARAVTIAIAPLDVSGIVDWPGGANWSRVAPNVGSISTDAAGWVDAQRSEISASRNGQPRVDEAASTSSPSEQGVEVALPNSHPVPDCFASKPVFLGMRC